jgi:hypothetical protein
MKSPAPMKAGRDAINAGLIMLSDFRPALVPKIESKPDS